MSRICFLNPFGTSAYDDLITASLRPALQGATEVEVRHLAHAPADIDYYAPKHLVESEVMSAAVAAEQEGFDAFVIGCCYDPALTQCRELVDIPVIGPLEASVMLSRLFGHSFAVLTDHHKAVPELRDRVRLYGLEGNCRGIDAIAWFVEDMVLDPTAVARDTAVKVRQVLDDDGRRDGGHRVHHRVGLLRAGGAGRRRPGVGVGDQPQRDGRQGGRAVRRPPGQRPVPDESDGLLPAAPRPRQRRRRPTCWPASPTTRRCRRWRRRPSRDPSRRRRRRRVGRDGDRVLRRPRGSVGHVARAGSVSGSGRPAATRASSGCTAATRAGRSRRRWRGGGSTTSWPPTSPCRSSSAPRAG